MLSMKTLRVAVVTVGSALLLGSGLAAAQTTIELDGTAGTFTPPIRLAAESISTAEGNRTTRGTTVLGYDVNVGTVTIAASARTSIPSGYFVRVKLNGAVFRTDPDSGSVTGLGAIAEGGGLSDQVVYAVPDTGIARRTSGGAVSVSLAISELLAVSSAAPGTVTASIEAYSDQFDAINGTGALSSRFFGGSAAIIQKTSGITAAVRAGSTAIADAATGFRWFVNPAGNPANTASATLGSFVVNENIAGTTNPTVDASTGSGLVAGALIPADPGVQLSVAGNLGLGAFSLARDDTTTTPDVVDVDCPEPTTGTSDSPLMGNVRGTMDMPNSATVSTSTGVTAPVFGADSSQGTYTLCVTVDTMGAMSNTMPLPDTEYMGTILLPNANAAIPARELASGVIGKIERNGASVDVTFLTTAEKYNQRLIVVNRGSRDVYITDVALNTEDGTEASVADGVGAMELMIGAGERKVYIVGDMLDVMPRNRASATLSFNGVASDISVATTVVNRDDGSTDTVMWPVH